MEKTIQIESLNYQLGPAKNLKSTSFICSNDPK